MRDYGYLEHMDRIPQDNQRDARSQRHGARLVEEGERFTVRLWKEKKQA